MSNDYNSLYFKQLKYDKENISFLKKNNFSLKEINNFSDLRKNEFNYLGINTIFCYQGFYYNESKLKKFKNLKFLVSNTTSDTFIDHKYCKKKKIKILTLRKSQKFLKKITPTAEHTVGLIIALTRNYVNAISSISSSIWDRRPYAGNKMLSKSTIGIIGGGRLGLKVCEIMKAFGSKIILAEKKNKNFKKKMNEMCLKADIITLHIPEENNQKFFSEKNFKCKKEFFLINTSRGEIVDEKYIIKLLKKKTMSGYAADVIGGEFRSNFRLSKNILYKNRKKFNILLTPHIGGSTKDAWKITERQIILELKKELDI
jgi:lactate dehydrogenase-like 2-hydroxyacid dehydrogenase